MYAMATAGSGWQREVRPASAIGSLMGRLVMLLTRCRRRKPREVSGIPFPIPPLIKGIRECFSQPCCSHPSTADRENLQKLSVYESHETEDQWNVKLGGNPPKKAQCQEQVVSNGANCLEILTRKCRRGCRYKGGTGTDAAASCCPGGEEIEDSDPPKWVNPKYAVAIPFPISAAIQGAEAIVNQPCCLPSP